MESKGMEHTPYPTDLTDNEWRVIAPLLPASDQPGRPRKYSWRDILKAVFSVRRTGCPWRGLPQDFPTWTTASHDLRAWRQDGTWKRIHDR
jgi:putative transposase